MKHIRIEEKENLAWIWLDNQPANEMTEELMDELIEAHRILADKKSVRAVLIGSKSDKFFSNGLDPSYMLERNAEGRIKVFAKLFEMMRVIYSFPKPEASVINGHAMAGGAVLAILTDFRFMSEGKARYCFSEVLVGLTIPPTLLRIIESVVGRPNLREVAMLGKAFKPEEARSIGLVDSLYAPDDLHKKAESYMLGFMDLPQASVQSIKKGIRIDMISELNSPVENQISEFKPFVVGNFEEGLKAVLEKRRPKFSND
ncbi:enoyl-CoA hydratase/isomerase family protein [Leptospira langatensis]|uniref:Enoyl-CoA hydratase/isomerase family protein n=1 Tax=Leptospira langatensis TaxID=2484983 RepID=A0A5F1ZR14_9LEPT|nr:enoyl-CoA hydratase/isomerase family protein [Leptospira langatensis]TGK02662.1 enoyl-CoA hydratase/isomerase family protein [Leptospira langatensis]TGL40135.1 enoyl-CoA hydratase/isomerase family protein [Leptospira langatensis]